MTLKTISARSTKTLSSLLCLYAMYALNKGIGGGILVH